MVQTILPWLAHIETRTQRHSCTHTHIHTVTIIKIDKACNLLHSGLNRDLCVRHLSLSLTQRACHVSLYHSVCVSQSLTCVLSVLLYITSTLSQKYTHAPIPPKQKPTTHRHTRAHTHTSSVLDTVDYN